METISWKTYKISNARWTCAVIGLLLGLVGFCVSLSLFPYSESPDEFKQAIIIDAGSAHTNFLMYSWSDTSHINLTSECYGDFAISDFHKNPGQEIQSAFEPCLSKLKTDAATNISGEYSRVFLQRHLWIVNYYVKKFIKNIVVFKTKLVFMLCYIKMLK